MSMALRWRRLHHSMPPQRSCFLQLILDVLSLLTHRQGVAIALSTATQPERSTRAYFDARQNLHGLDDLCEIIGDTATRSTPSWSA